MLTLQEELYQLENFDGRYFNGIKSVYKECYVLELTGLESEVLVDIFEFLQMPLWTTVKTTEKRLMPAQYVVVLDFVKAFKDYVEKVVSSQNFLADWSHKITITYDRLSHNYTAEQIESLVTGLYIKLLMNLGELKLEELKSNLDSEVVRRFVDADDYIEEEHNFVLDHLYDKKED